MPNETIKSEGPEHVWTASVFSDAISGIPTHNYLNNAYHEANLYSRCPPYDLHWQVAASSAPLKVRRLLRVDGIISVLKASITKARKTIEESKPYLDVEVSRRIHYSPDGPHPWMHPSIKVERHEKEGYAPGWDYTFNGHSLALALLDDYEKFIDTVARSRRAPFTRIACIHRMAESYRDSVELVRTEMSYHDARQWHSSS